MCTVYDALIIPSIHYDKSPLVVSILNRALKLGANHSRFLVFPQGRQLSSDLLQTIAIHLRGGYGTFELSEFDLGFLDLRADLNHFLLETFDFHDIAHEQFRLFKIGSGGGQGCFEGLFV